MANVIGWFEIPVTDMERAVKFYSSVFGYEKMDQMNLGGLDMAIFPMQKGDVSGALCKGEFYKPSSDGVVIYFLADPDLNIALSKVESAGGKVLMPKKLIAEDIGYMALFNDSEGNRIALHSTK